MDKEGMLQWAKWNDKRKDEKQKTNAVIFKAACCTCDMINTVDTSDWV